MKKADDLPQKRHKRTFSEDERIQAQESVKKTESESDADLDETEDPLMLSRDAKDWKGQDHYAVLGLSKLRYKATDEQIKRAHRKKVLKHHPDKRAASGSTEDDSFFKCIQKATEILLDPVRRRQYDSVDENADVDPPSKKESKSGNFFKLWNPVFAAEGRFSKEQPVPRLGDDKSTKEQVEHFYNFWYSFDSWRSFEYLDEDVPDDGEHRDQKRQTERKNNNQRKKRKTEDTTRLRRLVDDCLALDERIKKFKKQEQEQKHKKKNDMEAEAKRAKEEAEKKAREEALAKQEQEAAEKAEKAEGKKAKEAAKTAAKKNKRVVRTAVKDANYFADGDADAGKIDLVLNDTDFLLTKIDPDELAALVEKLNVSKEPASVHGVFEDEVTRLVGAGKMKEGEAKSLRL